jgi:hypothetical protein
MFRAVLEIRHAGRTMLRDSPSTLLRAESRRTMNYMRSNMPSDLVDVKELVSKCGEVYRQRLDRS